MLEEYIQDKISEAYYYMQNDTEIALKIFNDILEIEPDNIEALNGKGSSLIKLNRFSEAENYFNQSLSICENSSALLNKGLIFKHNHDFENALKYYDKASKLNPDLENIVEILKNEITPSKDRIDLSNFNDNANRLIKQGIKFKNEKKLFDSYDSFMKAIEHDSTCRDIVEELIYEIKTVLRKEFIYHDREFDINSKIDRLKMQAQRALIKENNPKTALTLMNLVLELDENDINTLNHKGSVFFICDEFEKAIECFDECLRINKDYYYALFNKALMLRIMKRLPEALECFNELLKTPINQNKIKPYKIEILEKLKRENNS